MFYKKNYLKEYFVILQEIYRNFKKKLTKNYYHQYIAKNPIDFGIKSLIFFAIIFLSWAIFLPIESASIAEGIVIVELKRKIIQHREGGIVEKIFVKEGQIVKTNEILIRLLDIKSQSEKNILQQQLWNAELQKIRLEAQRQNNHEIDLNNYFTNNSKIISEDEKNNLKKTLQIQEQIFYNDQLKRDSEIKILKNKLKSSKKLLSLLQHELSMIEPLVKENNISIIRLFELEKSIAQAQQNYDNSLLEVYNYKKNELSDILREINECNMQIIALNNQLKASQDLTQRLEIKSPTNGKVMNIKYHGNGAVVTPASEIMTIIPQDDELIVEAKINPNDIDNVKIGMICKIQLNAFKSKKTPKINGEISSISADILYDDFKKEFYFLARIKINEKQISRLKNKIDLYPGMLASVFIINDSRSFISYFFSPIFDSLYKSFREN